jgi:TolB-like protein/Flp pilus assembly protein TadD
MLTSDGTVKVVDFGLAKLGGDVKITGSGVTLGTAAYMSPEQLRGEAADHRADIWALGVVLYEMLCGRAPFAGDYPQAVFYTILNEEPKPVTAIRGDIPPELEACVEKALQKEAGQRYQHMEEMLETLISVKSAMTVSGSIEGSATNVSRKQSPVKKTTDAGKILSIAVLLIALAAILGYLWFRKGAESSVAGNSDRVAVLPFENIGADEQDAYFADGMTEELISNISNIGELQVIARTSVMQYKGVNRTISEIGSMLNVGTVIRGSLRRDNNRLRITVQLIDVASETNLWSQEYDREFKDVFAIQSDISQRVARALKIHLKEKEIVQIDKAATRNLEAYEFYLKGLYFLNKRTPSAIYKSMEYFKQAVESDSLFALAYTGLADAYSLFGSTEYGLMPPRIAREQAKAAALKALQLDETLAEAYTSLADIRTFYDWDWAGAEQNFKRAIELNANYANAHHGYALYLVSMGRTKEALEEIDKAQELDPLSPIINLDIASILQFSRRYDEALEKLNELLEFDDHFVIAYVVLGFTYELKNMPEEAVAAVRKAQELAGEFPMVLASAGYVLAKSGKREEAEQILQELLKLYNSNEVYLPPLYIALVYLGLGELDKSLDWTEKAYQERSSYLVYLKVDPKLDALRSQSRFAALMEKIGFKK